MRCWERRFAPPGQRIRIRAPPAPVMQPPAAWACCPAQRACCGPAESRISRPNGAEMAENGTKNGGDQSAAARRRRRADRGNWHPRNPIPGPDGRLEHAIRRAQLTPLLRLCLPCSSPPCLRIRPCPLGGTHLSAPASCLPLGISPFVPRCYSAPFIDQRTIARACTCHSLPASRDEQR